MAAANDNTDVAKPKEPELDPEHRLVKEMLKAFRDSKGQPDIYRLRAILLVLGNDLTPDMAESASQAWAHVRVQYQAYEVSPLPELRMWTNAMVQLTFVWRMTLRALFGSPFVAPVQPIEDEAAKKPAETDG